MAWKTASVLSCLGLTKSHEKMKFSTSPLWQTTSIFFLFFLKWKWTVVTSSRSPSKTRSLYKDSIWDRCFLNLATFIIRQTQLWTTWFLEAVFQLGLFSHKHFFVSTDLHLSTSQGGPSSSVPSCHREGLQSTFFFSLPEQLMNKLI